ncbi:MAG: 23S rRNA (uracil(1939)-C(5))-methyltransferase RlmD [Ruminococcaceae bacterium]|nr:23S rRNA (uracil(1939)-C(5))-methyltransferase RlmD [Oscillospiraceae bacterium]
MVQKKETYVATVTDQTVAGDGVVKFESYPIFVKGGVKGDEIRLKVTKTNKTYGFGELTEIIKPSKNRRTPNCPSFSHCGGCSLMHMDYEAQLEFKSDFVLSNITRIGGYGEGEFEFEKIIGADNEYNYRNKAQFPVGISKGKTVCGFYLPKSHIISPCESCNIQDERINKALKMAMEYIRKEKITPYDEKTHKGIIRHIYIRTGKDEIMVAFVTNSKRKLPNTDALAKKLASFGKVSLVQNINTGKTNVILGYENIVLYGDDHIIIELDDLRFKVSPNSFFQVNTSQMQKLYAKALEYAAPEDGDTVFDLYSGVGSISLFLSKKASKVIGVEIVPDAVENAKENAKINNIENVHFFCGDCTEVVEKLISKGEKADIAVVDPPRKGCDENLLTLLKNMNPKKIVYVSCNSSTLARDLVILREYGYVLKKACAVDMFPQTCHVETVVLLQRQNT